MGRKMNWNEINRWYVGEGAALGEYVEGLEGLEANITLFSADHKQT